MADGLAERRRRFRLGLRAETLAALWLGLKGYRILARRWRCPAGEVDLIARRGRTLAYVEVKARQTVEAGLEAVSARARARIRQAGEQYRARRRTLAACQPRCDLIVVRPSRLPRHLAGMLDS